MLVECLFCVYVLMISLCLLVGFLGMCSMDLFVIMDDMKTRSEFNQLRMVIENDLFIRRRSAISTATNGKDKFYFGFWEYTEGEMKYLIYDFHLQADSNRIRRLTRNCFNQDDLSSDESGIYCHRMISNISKGIYSTPNRIEYQQDYSQFALGDIAFDAQHITIKLGDYHYVFQ